MPKLSEVKRTEMSLTVPGILGILSSLMMQPPQHIIDDCGILPEVIDEAFTNNPVQRDLVVATLAKIRVLRGAVQCFPGGQAAWRPCNGDLVMVT